LVAGWNNVSISLSDFERVYFNSWQFKGMPDSPEVRRKVARELIEKEIIVGEAKKNNLIDEGLYQQRLKRDYARILRRRYLEATIKDTIKIPDEIQLKKLLLEKNKSVKVKQIFAKTKSEIEELSNRLVQGGNFEDIAKQASFDPSLVLADGTVGWITWENVDINVERVLFSLEVNQISKPVKSLVGWHIFKVDSISTVLHFNTDTDHYKLNNL
jgi:parvulin-like peptidyl-prolyl isomerase